MKYRMDAIDLADAASRCISITRTHNRAGTRQTYGDLHFAVGLRRPDEPWEPYYQYQIADVMDLASAIAQYTGERLDFGCYYNAATGVSGVGLTRPSRFSLKPVTRTPRPAWAQGGAS